MSQVTQFIRKPTQISANCLSTTNANPPAWKFLWAEPSYSTAYHGSYYPYVFTAHLYNATDQSPVAEAARYLTQYYVSFILHSNPNAGAGSNISWPNYGAQSQILLFGSNGVPVVTTDPDAGAQCQFFQAHPFNIQV